MAKNKDFEKFASKVFGNFGKDQSNRFTKMNKENVDENHPLPIDVVVVDTNQNVVSGEKRNHLVSPTSSISGHSNRPLTPVDINLESRISEQFEDVMDERSEQKPVYVRTKQLKQEEKYGYMPHSLRRSRPTSDYETDTDRPISSSDDSISIDSPSGSSVYRKSTDLNFGSRRDSSEAGTFFCIDHMKICDTRVSRLKHRGCHIDAHVPTDRSSDNWLARRSGISDMVVVIVFYFL